jgi:hypothetical protein
MERRSQALIRHAGGIEVVHAGVEPLPADVIRVDLPAVVFTIKRRSDARDRDRPTLSGHHPVVPVGEGAGFVVGVEGEGDPVLFDPVGGIGEGARRGPQQCERDDDEQDPARLGGSHEGLAPGFGCVR